MAGEFRHDLQQQLCEECHEICPANDAETSGTARYTLRRNMCAECARVRCADVIVADPLMSSTSHWKCNEHPDRDLILFCKKCSQPICDKCVHLSHSGHNYVDLNAAIQERQECAKKRFERIAEKSRELDKDKQKIELGRDDVNQRFDRLQYAVLVRVEEKSRTFDDDHCIAERRVERRAKEEKLRIDKWKDNRLKELKDEKNAKNRELQQKQHSLLRELNEVRTKLLHQLDEYSQGLNAANKIIAEARVATENILSGGAREILIAEDPSLSNTSLEDCLEAELDIDAISMVTDIAESVKFEPGTTGTFIGETASPLLGKFVTTRPSWCKLHTIQVGLPKFRLLGATKDSSAVTFTGEHGDGRFGLYTMDVGTGNTNLVASDAACVMDAASLDAGVIAVTRSDRGAIEIWNTRLGKVKKHIKVPKTWTHTCLAADNNGCVVARDHHSHGHGKIYVYRSNTGEKVRSVPYTGTIYSLFVLSNGDLVVQSAATEIVIIDGQTGAVKSSIRDEKWKWVRCTVDRDERVVVAYGRKDDAASISVDTFSSSDGAFFENIFKHKCNPSLEHIAVVASKSGRIVLQNGGDLVVYDRLIPLSSPSSPSPLSLKSSTTVDQTPRIQHKVFRRPRSTSCSPPTPTRCHHRFMCIPT